MFPVSLGAPPPGFYAWLAGTLAAPFILLLAAYFYYIPNAIKDHRRRHLPPGPQGLPFIGNMLDLASSDHVRHKVRAWHQRYSSVFHTKIGGTDYIWPSPPPPSKTLMDKRSSIYSSSSCRTALAGGRSGSTATRCSARRAAVRYQPVQDSESKLRNEKV